MKRLQITAAFLDNDFLFILCKACQTFSQAWRHISIWLTLITVGAVDPCPSSGARTFKRPFNVCTESAISTRLLDFTLIDVLIE